MATPPTIDTLRSDIALAKACLDYARAYGNRHDQDDAQAHLDACLDAYALLAHAGS